MEIQVREAVVRLAPGDITKIPADVIVNAANSDLIGGGGVDGAIHRAGGPAIMLELNRIRPINGCPTGSAVLTGAGNLPAKYVAHAVGPIWEGGERGEADDLASAHLVSLRLAAGKGAVSVTFPAISTGAYGYPLHLAAPVALGAVASYLKEERATSIRLATFVLLDARAMSAFERAMKKLAV
jgi:O-acetyl-ADP-ribose deacetylase (regulator of RNase III)